MIILAALLLVLVFVALVFVLSVWAFRAGDEAGYNRGRREIDKWWVEMDQQLDEEWMKIWRDER